MSKNKNKYRFRVVMILITSALITFAFVHSMMPADESAQESGNVLEFIQNILNAIGLESHLTDYIIRKTAHFCEYTAIGLFLMNTAYSFNKTQPHKYYPQILLVGILTAVTDETIQLFVEGRSGQVTDIVLDFTGIITGTIIMWLILCLYRKIRKIK